MTTLLFGLSFVVGLIPDDLLQMLARMLAFLVFDVFRYRRKVMAENILQAFPEKTSIERAEIEKQAGLHLALSLLEFLKIPRYAARNYENVVRVEGWEHYHEARKQEKGVFILTGHLGSFELSAGAVAMQLQEHAYLVVKSFPDAVNRFMNSVRQSKKLTPVSAKGAIKPVLKAVKNKDMVVFVQDQNSTRHIGVFVDFFGKPACTMSGLAVLALRTRTPVLGVSIWREAPGKHVLKFHPAIPLKQAESKEAAVVQMTQIYTTFIEDRICEHPAQWLWTHRRWKTRP
jgi:KDO2-lipid IV(A) lauroyltransferase